MIVLTSNKSKRTKQKTKKKNKTFLSNIRLKHPNSCVQFFLISLIDIYLIILTFIPLRKYISVFLFPSNISTKFLCSIKYYPYYYCRQTRKKKEKPRKRKFSFSWELQFFRLKEIKVFSSTRRIKKNIQTQYSATKTSRSRKYSQANKNSK